MWAWDLRAGGAQALYELSTGNTRVQALAWHQGSNSLLASCESAFCDQQGGSRRGDWERVNSGNDAEGKKRWWPKRAKHVVEDFKGYWTEAGSCVVQYRFSDGAGAAVPESAGPSFG